MAGQRVFVVGNFVQACCWYVPTLPRPGQTLVATALQVEPGGKGLNVAIGLARLGAEVSTLIGCGDDSAGDQLLALLRAEHIATQHVHQLPGASGWGSGWVAADGQNAIAVYPGANLQLTAAHAAHAHADVDAAQLVYGQFETALPALEAVFVHAAACGTTTVLNPSPWQAVSEVILRSTHTVIVNEVEVLALLDALDPAPPWPLEPARCARQINPHLGRFWEQWPAAQRLVVTLGALGSVAFERPVGAAPGTAWVAPPHAVTAVDSVGAGDAFAAGYCAAQLAGKSLADGLRWGNACGAHLAAHRGVLAALPASPVLAGLLGGADVPQAYKSVA